MASLTYLTSNLSGRVRRERLHGRDFLVAPLSLIVPGVLNGSRGPLYYPPSEISKDPTAWNGMPIVVQHPEQHGRAVSARHPSVLNKQGIGYVFGANSPKGALKGEGWFDEQRTRVVHPGIYTSLMQGTPIEVSTGLFTENDPAPMGATFNGRPYTYIARNYRPDHLAILPDRKGACSVGDGCGVLVNSAATPIFSPVANANIVPTGSGKYRLVSKGGKTIGVYDTLYDAQQQEWMIDAFKNNSLAVFTGNDGAAGGGAIGGMSSRVSSLPWMGKDKKRKRKSMDTDCTSNSFANIQFDESKHKRNKGKFASSGGAGAAPKGGSGPAANPLASAQGSVRSAVAADVAKDVAQHRAKQAGLGQRTKRAIGKGVSAGVRGTAGAALGAGGVSGGAWAGAKLGAKLGSRVHPVFGTAIGGVVGSLVGAYAGGSVAEGTAKAIGGEAAERGAKIGGLATVGLAAGSKAIKGAAGAERAVKSGIGFVKAGLGRAAANPARTAGKAVRGVKQGFSKMSSRFGGSAPKPAGAQPLGEKSFGGKGFTTEANPADFGHPQQYRANPGATTPKAHSASALASTQQAANRGTKAAHLEAMNAHGAAAKAQKAAGNAPMASKHTKAARFHYREANRLK